MKRLTDQTLYELLELRPDAPPADVREAIERARAIFGPGSLAMYSLMSSDEASLVNRRIEEAWVTLLDPEARARYDASLLASKGEGATAHPVASWTAALPPVIPARQEPRVEPAPVAPAAETSPEAAPAAPAVEPAVEPTPERQPETGLKALEVEAALQDEELEDDEESVEVEAVEVDLPTPLPATARAPLLLVQPAPEAPLPPAATPAPAVEAPPRAPIRLERPVSLAAAMTPVPQAVSAPPRAEEPTPAFAEGAPWTGEMLRKVREARGLPLQIIAERTKVTRHHLENIEGDRFKLLPAPVYLRGILLGLARELRLDGQKVARSYLERMTEALSPPPSTPGPKR